MFKGRDLIIATKHEKEKVIASILEKELGVKCFVNPNLDTDRLGTFTGEVDRKDDPITTARNKCLMAMKLTNCDLAVASEGSFGPHPSLYFIPADFEFLLFIDKKNDLEIIVSELSSDTNFNAKEIKTKKELAEFSTNTKFPSHGLIIRKSKHDFDDIIKGITNTKQLNNAFNKFITNFDTAYIETDMRAMYNPTRMNVIKIATHKLVEKINTICPDCNTPGLGITDSVSGLPCDLCNYPTRGTLSHIYTCVKCEFTEYKQFPQGKQTEDPMYCDFCNP